MTTTADLMNLTAELSELVEHVLAGHEVILTKASEPVARIVPIGKESTSRHPLPPLKIHSLSRPRVLIPGITGAEIAEEMFHWE